MGGGRQGWVYGWMGVGGGGAILAVRPNSDIRFDACVHIYMHYVLMCSAMGNTCPHICVHIICICPFMCVSMCC